MPHRTTTRAFTIVGALTALAGTAVLGASPARADTDVVPFAHARIHAAPALGGRVVGSVDPGHHFIGQCWTNGDLVKDRGISNPNWVRLKLPSGVTGFVPAVYLKGNDKGNVANHC
jgi:hypothetical protein